MQLSTIVEAEGPVQTLAYRTREKEGSNQSSLSICLLPGSSLFYLRGYTHISYRLPSSALG